MVLNIQLRALDNLEYTNRLNNKRLDSLHN